MLGDALRVCPAGGPGGPRYRGWCETCALEPPEVSAARGRGGEEPAVRRKRATKIRGMKARSVPTRPPQGARSAAPVTPEKKPCCSVQGRFPSPSLPLNLRPVRQALWQRRTAEHGERRWASPLDCLGCRFFVFYSAAATIRGHRAVRLRPKPPARRPGLPRQGVAARHYQPAGKTRPEPPRLGRGSPPVSGVGRTRGGRRRRRRRARPSPLLPRLRLQGPALGRSCPPRRKKWESRGFPSAAPLHEASSTGEESGGRVASPASPKPPSHPVPTSQQGHERRGDSF